MILQTIGYTMCEICSHLNAFDVIFIDVIFIRKAFASLIIWSTVVPEPNLQSKKYSKFPFGYNVFIPRLATKNKEIDFFLGGQQQNSLNYNVIVESYFCI